MLATRSARDTAGSQSCGGNWERARARTAPYVCGALSVDNNARTHNTAIVVLAYETCRRCAYSDFGRWSSTKPDHSGGQTVFWPTAPRRRTRFNCWHCRRRCRLSDGVPVRHRRLLFARQFLRVTPPTEATSSAAAVMRFVWRPSFVGHVGIQVITKNRPAIVRCPLFVLRCERRQTLAAVVGSE